MVLILRVVDTTDAISNYFFAAFIGQGWLGDAPVVMNLQNESRLGYLGFHQSHKTNWLKKPCFGGAAGPTCRAVSALTKVTTSASHRSKLVQSRPKNESSDTHPSRFAVGMTEHVEMFHLTCEGADSGDVRDSNGSASDCKVCGKLILVGPRVPSLGCVIYKMWRLGEDHSCSHPCDALNNVSPKTSKMKSHDEPETYRAKD